MSKTLSSVAVLAVFLAFGLAAQPADAQQARTFVSGLGSDTNAPNCSRTAPCRTFQTAHNNTLANGEITVLDPGSYGSVMINRNISIVNDGVGEAGLLVSGGGIGIMINAAGAAVTLRGLTIKGIGFGGGNAVIFNTGGSLRVENCVIRNLETSESVSSAISFRLPGHGTTSLTVVRSAVFGNGSAGLLADGIGATLRVGETAVEANAPGWLMRNGGALLSYGDNAFGFNSGPSSPAPVIGMK